MNRFYKNVEAEIDQDFKNISWAEHKGNKRCKIVQTLQNVLYNINKGFLIAW